MKVFRLRLVALLAGTLLAVGCGSQAEERDSSASSGGGSGGTKMGDISDEETDLDFEAHSAYAILSEAGLLSLTITDYAPSSDMFREIDDYECVEIPEAEEDDEDGPTLQQLTLTWMAAPVEIEDYKVDDDGLPTEDEYKTEEGEDNSKEGLTISFFDGDEAVVGYGTVEFDTLPEDVDEEMELTVELDLDGDEYTATITAEVKELPEAPDMPDCDDDEYPKAIYE